MTRQHFRALAQALKDSQPARADATAIAQWKFDVHNVAAACAQFNPNFDRLRFYKACGV